jgi:hypothetical protein
MNEVIGVRRKWLITGHISKAELIGEKKKLLQREIQMAKYKGNVKKQRR